MNKNNITIDITHPLYETIKNIIEDYNKQKIIVAFCGRAGAGKDYQSDLLQKQGYKKMAFADSLRYVMRVTLNLDENWNYEELKKTPLYNGQTLRDMMEHLGTEGIRHYDNDFWIKATLKDIKSSSNSKICISDLRFSNEYYKLKEFAEQNGYLFKCVFCNYRSDRYQETNNHPSAKMSNYFATHGYKDLDEIRIEDIEAYEGDINE